MSLSEIRAYIQSIPLDNYLSLISVLRHDKRKTVRQLAEKLNKELLGYHDELARIEKMKMFEQECYSQGYELVAGIDEVGRGPLAGPVVSAAVILPKDCNILFINDSKKLSIKKREKLYHQIKEEALDIGIGIVDANVIDEINIYQATKVSMALAVKDLRIKPDFLLIDAMKCDNIPISQLPINKGDSKSLSIAAASIIAKVTRDEMMNEYHKELPYYAFDKNKGYGTLEHREGISKRGITNIHRQTFLKNII